MIESYELELPERERCGHCGAFLTEVPVIWKTKYGDIPATMLECHNPRCPETKRRESEGSRQ